MKDHTTPKKLSPAMVVDIERMLKEGQTHEEIAKIINRKPTATKKCFDEDLISSQVNTVRWGGKSVPVSSNLNLSPSAPNSFRR